VGTSPHAAYVALEVAKVLLLAISGVLAGGSHARRVGAVATRALERRDIVEHPR